MEQLELKHLAPYLPYGLKLKNTDIPMNGRMCELLSTYNYTERKPILRPLSDYADVNSVAMNDLNTDLMLQIEIADFASGYISINSLSYGAYEDMIASHIDVFGLIGKGLAVDLRLDQIGIEMIKNNLS